MKDRIGVEIKPGDYVAYAVTTGRSGCLHIGKVIEIVQREKGYMHKRQYEKAKIEIVEYYKSADDEDDWYFRYRGKDRPIKTTYIEFEERIVVVNHYVPKPKKTRGPEGAEKVL